MILKVTMLITFNKIWMMMRIKVLQKKTMRIHLQIKELMKYHHQT